MKLPHFFKYAKDKEEDSVDSVNNSTVNKLNHIIPNKPIQFKKVSGNCDYKLLMKDLYPNDNKDKKQNIIDEFIKLNRIKNKFTYQDGYDEEGFNQFIKAEMLKLFKNESYISDILVEHFFQTDSAFKKTLWACYGEYLLENLLLKIGNTFSCESCGNRNEKTKSKQLYCAKCSKEIDRLKAKDRMKAKRLKKCSI